MVEISKLSRLIDGANRNISLSTNTIVVDNIKLRLGNSNSVTMSGTLTADRTISVPNDNVDLGDILSLNELSGMPAGSTSLGIFTGTVITNYASVKEALQELETYSETGISGLASDVATLQSDVGTLQSNVVTLQSDVATLQSSVAALIAITPAKEVHPMSAVPSNLTYIDLAHQAISLTLQVSVDRLLLHEGDDYLISLEELTPGTLTTRLTWTGDIAIGGSQALDLTDVVRVKYYYSA